MKHNEADCLQLLKRLSWLGKGLHVRNVTSDVMAYTNHMAGHSTQPVRLAPCNTCAYPWLGPIHNGYCVVTPVYSTCKQESHAHLPHMHTHACPHRGHTRAHTCTHIHTAHTSAHTAHAPTQRGRHAAAPLHACQALEGAGSKPSPSKASAGSAR